MSGPPPQLRVVFMGTPGFAEVILRRLCDSRHEVVGVVTRPDSPSGRGRKLAASAVATAADELGLEVTKPTGKRDPELPQCLRRWEPDVVAVAAFGIILPQEVLDLPRLGCVNVHASLLPKFRGAAPVQDAIIKGERETGVTTMQMDAGLDTGGILLQRATPIGPDVTAGELEETLAALGAGLLIETLDGVGAGDIEPVPQDDSLSSYSKSLAPEDGLVLWNEPAVQTHNRIRGCTPRPGARCYLKGAAVRIWRSELIDEAGTIAPPGSVVTSDAKGLVVACGTGSVRLVEVQPAARPRMASADYARGIGTPALELKFDIQAPEAAQNG